ncbi:sugar phosphate nucleotidyltransferase [Terasakiella sp. A23]|uniref:sugar phosphate nucleotidyltransferase n=1 Tax=Terasakiella sp. FCG-A23 TaxID=3080561 RepID=UPI002954EEEA|nr:sugar phosphate nucleotidyltransferase [Terasakiella sp. A23]MDV7339034.1 sugar phosphate nucleotidyltransferase [Terasakiella sp. A23]
MQYVFLVGGFGTRLGQRTKTTPKPLLSIAGKPFLLHLIKWAKAASAHQVLLLSGYKGGQIQEFAKTHSTKELPIEVVQENAPLGTGGSILNARQCLEDQFIAANGDSWLAFDPTSLSDMFSKHKDIDGVMALRHLDNTASSGIVHLNQDDIITHFEERGGNHPGLINAGIYHLKKAVLDNPNCPEGVFSIERDFFPKLAKENKLAGQTFDRFFIDIGTPDNFEKADQTFFDEMKNFASSHPQNPNFMDMIK